ncbi:MAG: hypothetical protein WD079_07105 [Phycisphaeraceae bacterium]
MASLSESEFKDMPEKPPLKPIIFEAFFASIAFAVLLGLIDRFVGGQDVTSPGYLLGIAGVSFIFFLGYVFLTYRARKKG